MLTLLAGDHAWRTTSLNHSLWLLEAMELVVADFFFKLSFMYFFQLFIVFILSSIKESWEGNSLVVQWLRLRPPMQGTLFLSLVRELDPICHN